MICLFKPAPKGKGNESWSKIGDFGCFHSRNIREPFYFSQIRSKNSDANTLQSVGYTAGRLAVRHPGTAHGLRTGLAFLDNIQFSAITGDSPALDGVAEAKAILRAIRVEYVDGDVPPSRGDHLYSFTVGHGFKCNPKAFGQYLVFLVGYWGWIIEGVSR